MIDNNINSLTKERLHRLFSAIGTAQQQDEQVESTNYNWREPHYFNTEQLRKIGVFAEKYAASLSEKLGELCRDKFEVTAKPPCQYFAAELANRFTDKQNNDYSMPFGSNPEHPFGFVGIPQQTACIWARQLLGDSETEDKPGKSMSQLEESLLSDMAVAIVGTLAKFYPAGEIKPAKTMIKGQWPLGNAQGEELCRITLGVKKAGSQSGTEFELIISCGKLDNQAGKTAGGENKMSAGDITKIIYEHLGSFPVCVTANLAAAEFGFEDILNLQAGDIMLLDKTVDEPVSLVVQEQVFGFGRLARCSDQYAVAVTATKFPNAAQNKNPGGESAKQMPGGTTISRGKK
jgi:flagellar motor switch protein FliM